VDAAGDSNGIVCRRALGQGVGHTDPNHPEQVYFWQDDATPRNL
jgi:hypothetical protein